MAAQLNTDMDLVVFADGMQWSGGFSVFDRHLAVWTERFPGEKNRNLPAGPAGRIGNDSMQDVEFAGGVALVFAPNFRRCGGSRSREGGRRLVGEPAGGKPSSYGEVKLLTLPNSKLVVQYTSKFFGKS